MKTVPEEVLEEEMAEHLKAGYRELTPTRRGGRVPGHYTRNLVTPAGTNAEVCRRSPRKRGPRWLGVPGVKRD